MHNNLSITIHRLFGKEDDLVAEATKILLEKGLIVDSDEDIVVLTGGSPMGQHKSANFIKILNGKGKPANTIKTE